MRALHTEHKRRPSLLSGVAVSFVTICLCLLGLEIGLEHSSFNPYQWDKRLMFFSGGSVFQNQKWGGFVYQPNARIHSLTYYITDQNIPNLTKEYEYEVRTNSSGLVQAADLDKSRPSIIFLGDSYTEGQGADPWFYQLESSWLKSSKYQVINGGILGTGFETWERLYQSLAITSKINKIVIIFISSDWIRSVWQFSDQDLECLKSAALCKGSDNFYGLPDNQNEADLQINRIARARIDYLAVRKKEQNILKTSAIYQRLLWPAYNMWSPRRKAEDEMNFEKSKNAILSMATAVGSNNLMFIHLPQKDELNSGIVSEGRRGRDFIRRHGFVLVDGFEKCGLKVTDYHLHDGHPNSSGYSKIAECVDRSVREVFHPF
jgi:hypothetical protein